MIFQKQIEKIYRSRTFIRYDGSELMKYYCAKDFPGLVAEPYEFTSSLGHRLQGYFYCYEGARKDCLIVFDHGLGPGHQAYMKEINLLCSHGYKVFAYDHTGCVESGGYGTNGLSQSLCDLNDCLNTLKADESVDTSCLYVMGHSWGGFSTLNISALHPDVRKIVVLAGFVSVYNMIVQNFPGPLKLYRKHIMKLEAEHNPVFSGYNAVETLKSSSVKALLIYSDNDMMVDCGLHYGALKNGLSDKENVTLVLESEKGHNPTYSHNGVRLLVDMYKSLEKNTKRLKTPEQRKAYRDSLDWESITEQDMRVWGMIFEHLDS